MAEIFARQGEAYFRAAERAVLLDQLLRAARRGRHRRRHVRRPAEPGRDQRRRRVGLARRAAGAR